MRTLLALLLIAQIAPAADLGPKWLVPDQILFADDFSQPGGEIKLDRKNAPEAPWQPNQGTRWEVIDGVLRGRASSPEFQASRARMRKLAFALHAVHCATKSG